MQVLEVVVIVGVFIAIGAELIALVWNAIVSVKTFLRERREKKLEERVKMFSEAERKSRITSEDHEMGLQKQGTFAH